MEDYLNCFHKERGPILFFQMEDVLIKFQMEDDLNYFTKWDNLIIFSFGRRPQFFSN